MFHFERFGMMKNFVTVCVFVAILISTSAPAQTSGLPENRPGKKVQPLPHAHAHNDYEHKRPLFDALDHGFCSVEADIFFVNGQLLVAHELSRTKPERTLESLYLDPLQKIAQESHGHIFPDTPEFFLLIDIKSDAAKTYPALRASLSKYAAMLTTFQNGTAKPGAVTVVLTGNRPIDLLARETISYAGLDGRLDDLLLDPNPQTVWISDNWQKNFRWRGTQPMNEAEKQKVREIVAKAHARHQKVRFWGTVDHPEVWRELLSLQVDLINTDNLAGLENFFAENRRD
jgi:glycerophosphoryl diester phosphodiesterase